VSLRGWEASATDHLAIYHEVDIALDSFPYNGATTTCEALYMGVPVVSLAGDRHAGRMGASLLNAAGLGYLVARSAEQYVTIAANLAADLPALAALRASLRAQLQASAIMDESGFTRRLEDCYLQLWQECLRERSPDAQAAGSTAERLARAQSLRDAGPAPGVALTEATDLCHAVLRAEPDNEQALTLVWDLAYDAGAPGAAVEWINRGLAVRETSRMHYMLGCVLQSQGRLEEAAAAFRRTLALDASHARAANNLGCVHEAAGHRAEAERHYRQAIALDAQLAQAHYNLGNLQRQQGQGESAIDSLCRALQVDGRQADWHCNLGELQAQHRQWDAAIMSLRAALAADPAHDRARLALADALLACGDTEQALDVLPERSAPSPWRAAMDLRRLQLQQTLHPETSGATLAAQRRWWENHGRTVLRGTTGPRPGRSDAQRRPLRVAYLLPDAGSVAARAHIAPLLLAHDAAVVRVHGYALATHAPELEAPLRSACAVWRDVSEMDDEAVVRQLRADGIDVLVDLACSAGAARPGVLARQAVRVQCSWPLAAPGVVLPGAALRITDEWCDPQDRETDDEQLLRLARPALCYRPPGAFVQAEAAPAAAGAPLVFGWLGSPSELSPSTWAAWAAILQAVPQSRLQLGSSAFASELAQERLRECAAAAGIDDARLELRATDEADPAFFSAVDIALDSFPLNGLGSCAALWAGVPVVSLAGRGGVARRGAGILAAADASEGLAASSGGYVHTAVQWASEVTHLRAARQVGSRRVRSSRLADAAALARALEQAYAALIAA
jgi:predicted O-linked N-acetylglucosamine transferase (SPINDLY family)